jgi:hypothetical protein
MTTIGTFWMLSRTVRRRYVPLRALFVRTRYGHLSNIAMRLERKLHWDPEKEEFVNDSEANRMLVRAMRSPWHL